MNRFDDDEVRLSLAHCAELRSLDALAGCVVGALTRHTRHHTRHTHVTRWMRAWGGLRELVVAFGGDS